MEEQEVIEELSKAVERIVTSKTVKRNPLEGESIVWRYRDLNTGLDKSRLEYLVINYEGRSIDTDTLVITVHGRLWQIIDKPLPYGGAILLVPYGSVNLPKELPSIEPERPVSRKECTGLPDNEGFCSKCGNIHRPKIGRKIVPGWTPRKRVIMRTATTKGKSGRPVKPPTHGDLWSFLDEEGTTDR